MVTVKKRKLFFCRLFAAAIIIIGCSEDDPVKPIPPEDGCNWFTVDDTRYEVALASVVTGLSDPSFDTIGVTMSQVVLSTSTGSTFMPITFIGNNVVGSWTLPSREVYFSLMGHNSKLYFFLPVTPEDYLAIDECKDGGTMIGGTLNIKKVVGQDGVEDENDIYEVKVEGVKVTTTIHQTDDFNDSHPEGTVTLSACYRGPLTRPLPATQDCPGVTLPSNFLLEYNAIFTFKLAKIGNDFYDAMNDEFFKKNPVSWDSYKMNDDSTWTNKNQTVCPYTKCVMFWNPSMGSQYTSEPSEAIIGINCRKFSFQTSDMGITYWVHPDYDIVLSSSITFGGLQIEYTAISFSTDITTWSEVGITKP